MKIGLLGLIMSDLTDVNYDKMRWAVDLGFHGVGAHLSVPAAVISPEVAANARAAFDSVNLPFLQLWGPYPCIVSADEDVRRAGVEGARALARLAAQMGVPESGVRPTSLNPRGDWLPHPDNYKPETEDRLVRSLCEILETAEQHDMDCVGAIAMNCVEFVLAAACRARVKRGQWCAGRAKGWRRDQQNLSKVGLRRPVNRLLDGAVAWVGREIATPSAGGTTWSPA